TPAPGTGGVYPITFTASSTYVQPFTLTVVEALSITSPNAANFAAGAPGSVTITALGFPTPSLSAAGALPAGVTFTDNGNGTATLASTPAAGAAGSYPLTITAHNGSSPDATQAFTLTVTLSPT